MLGSGEMIAMADSMVAGTCFRKPVSDIGVAMLGVEASVCSGDSPPAAPPIRFRMGLRRCQ